MNTRNFPPVELSTVFRARCTACGHVRTIEDISVVYDDDETPVNCAIAHGWIARWETVDESRGLELVELLCLDCQPLVSS